MAATSSSAHDDRWQPVQTERLRSSIRRSVVTRAAHARPVARAATAARRDASTTISVGSASSMKYAISASV